MKFRKPCHMPFRKLIPHFTLTATHQLIVPSTLLAPATNIRTCKATKIHKLKPLTHELFFFKIALKGGRAGLTSLLDSSLFEEG